MNQPVKQILLVENSRTAKVSIKSKLAEFGFEVSDVSSGKEAVDIIQAKRFDAIVMDVFLPELNGYEATKIIRDLPVEWANLPIFAYSSSDNLFDKKRCLELGMTDYIIKSADHQGLIDKMTALF